MKEQAGGGLIRTNQEAQGLEGIQALIGIITRHEQPQHDAHNLGRHDDRHISPLWRLY